MKNGAARLVGAAKALGIDIPATLLGRADRRIRAMASQAIRDCIAYKPISTDPSRAEGIAGFDSRRAWSYKR
jgi:hypothetical protein